MARVTVEWARAAVHCTDEGGGIFFVLLIVFLHNLENIDLMGFYKGTPDTPQCIESFHKFVTSY